MAECNWCDSKAWFFQLDRSGLCKECGPTVKADIEKLKQELDAFDAPAADADWQTCVEHYDGIRSTLGTLLRYEGSGISTLDPPPSAALVDCGEARAQVILKAAREAVEATMAEAEAAAAPAQRIEVTSAGLAQVKTFQDLLGEPPPEFGENNATVLIRLAQQIEAIIDAPSDEGS